MAGGKKKKKSEGDDRPSHRIYRLVGGPRDGETMRLAPDPQEWIRLAFPEWCTYQWDGQDYVYRGTEPPPKVEAAVEQQREAWTPGLAPGQVSAAQQYINTEPYRRGVEAANGTEAS